MKSSETFPYLIRKEYGKRRKKQPFQEKKRPDFLTQKRHGGFAKDGNFVTLRENIGTVLFVLFYSILPFYNALFLSTKIPFVTGFVLILTVIVNLIAFQKIADRLVPIYQNEISILPNTPDPDKLKSFTELSELDDQTRKEYTDALSELSTISTALQNISTNPELYVGQNGSGASHPSSTALSIHTESGTLKLGSFFTVFNLRKLADDTPEGRLVRGIIQDLIVTNVLWLMFIYFIYMIWIRSIFTPVKKVTENIEQIAKNGQYSKLQYNKQDEFFPLISSINSLHQSLSLQERIRSNFLSDLSHEIRTPITAVKCYLEAIEDGVMKLDTKTLALFKTELTRLSDTTEGILEFEHATHPSERPIHVERFNLYHTLNGLIQQYEPQYQKTGQNIVINMRKDAMIRMDEGMLLQIVHNIFSNFIKYAGASTTLECNYRRTDTEAILCFTDNGVGIPEKDLPFVKEKFYRVDTGRSHADGVNMGIGLSIIDHIMKAHNGQFVIKNTEPRGLSIELHFPR